MSRDSDVRDMARRLEVLMGELRGNVDELNAILTENPEVPNGDAPA